MCMYIYIYIYIYIGERVPDFEVDSAEAAACLAEKTCRKDMPGRQGDRETGSNKCF